MKQGSRRHKPAARRPGQRQERADRRARILPALPSIPIGKFPRPERTRNRQKPATWPATCKARQCPNPGSSDQSRSTLDFRRRCGRAKKENLAAKTTDLLPNLADEGLDLSPSRPAHNDLDSQAEGTSNRPRGNRRLPASPVARETAQVFKEDLACRDGDRRALPAKAAATNPQRSGFAVSARFHRESRPGRRPKIGSSRS